MGVYHYAPKAHELERLWDIPFETTTFEHFPSAEWAEHASAIIIFTAVWRRSEIKYSDFSYLLSLLETGHMAQNILLTSAALHIAACPLAGFNDEEVSQLLDIDTEHEQAIYAVVLGKNASL